MNSYPKIRDFSANCTCPIYPLPLLRLYVIGISEFINSRRIRYLTQRPISDGFQVGKLTGIDFPYEHWSLEIIRLSSDQTKMILWSMILVTQINWTSNKQLKWQVKMFRIQIAILRTRPAMDANGTVFLIFFKNCDLYIKLHFEVSKTCSSVDNIAWTTNPKTVWPSAGGYASWLTGLNLHRVLNFFLREVK